MQEANGKFSNGGARGRLLSLHIQWHRESMIYDIGRQGAGN